MSRLFQLRRELESLSHQILEQLNQRARYVLEVASEKKKLNLPRRDSYRESSLIGRLQERNSGPLDDATVETFFEDIFRSALRLMGEEEQRGMLVETTGGPPLTVEIKGHRIGHGEPVYVAGPCAIESEEQLDQVASGLRSMGVGFLRGGAFKPRTSPYAFQGLGIDGLRMLEDAGERYNMVTITEATSPSNAESVARYADIIQVGSRNMYNYELLRAAGGMGKPVLLKRAFSASLREWLSAAEYLVVSGCDSVILCERGIRTFGTDTRNTLDLSVVPLAQAQTRLPVIVDVSHAAGRRDLLAPLATAAFAIGAQGVMVEVHPDPDMALSDADQQITLDDFARLRDSVAANLGRAASFLGGMEHPVSPLKEVENAAQRAM